MADEKRKLTEQEAGQVSGGMKLIPSKGQIAGEIVVVTPVDPLETILIPAADNPQK